VFGDSTVAKPSTPYLLLTIGTVEWLAPAMQSLGEVFSIARIAAKVVLSLFVD
jgi:hypothetical protein